MYCSQCGKELKDGIKFCTNCGAVVKQKSSNEINVGIGIKENTPVYDKNSLSSSDEIKKTEGNMNLEKERINNTILNQYQDNIAVKPKTKTNAGLIVIIVILIVMIIGVSGAAVWFLGGKDMIYDVFGIGRLDSIEEQGEMYSNAIDAPDQEEDESENIDNIQIDNSNITDIDSMIKEKIQEKTQEAETSDNDEILQEEPDKGASDIIEEESSEYLLENSDVELITKEDLEGFTAEQCRLARNEIYARHGRMFDDEELQNYFNSCSWYQGSIAPSDFNESMLNDVEVANRDLIVEYEKEMGYR